MTLRVSVLTPRVRVCTCLLRARASVCAISVPGSLSVCTCACPLRVGAQRRVTRRGGAARGSGQFGCGHRELLSCRPGPGPARVLGVALAPGSRGPGRGRAHSALWCPSAAAREAAGPSSGAGLPGRVEGTSGSARPRAGARAHGPTGTALAGQRLHSGTQAPVGLREAAGFFLLPEPGAERPPAWASRTLARGGMSDAPAPHSRPVSPPGLTAEGGGWVLGTVAVAPAVEKGLRSPPHGTVPPSPH